MTIGIYKIEDINGKLYIGSSTNIEQRIKRHRNDLAKNQHTNAKLQNAYNKYGIDYFSYSIIEITTKNDLLATEQRYLTALFDNYSDNAHYNILSKAYSALGYKHTSESLDKMSLAHKGNKLSKETRDRIGLAKRGKRYKAL